MKNCSSILGVDVSKLTLDITHSQTGLHIQVSNDTEGFRKMAKWARALKVNLTESLFLMEYTGGYEYRLLQFCQSKGFPYSRISGLAIKNSLGLSRGKNDKVDSKRIAEYGEEKIKKLEPSKPLDTNILKLKHLLAFRKRLVRENAGMKASSQERSHMYEVGKDDLLLKISERRMEHNRKDIKEVEAAIRALVQSDAALQKNFAIITSIKGIGEVNGWMTIAYTENFTSFPNARAYAVYVGVMPFDHQSGSSIKGRKRVSPLANKELKQELNQAAKTAIIHNTDMREYALKKKEKAYPTILNNVRFKLITLMFALVKRGEPFVDNYKRAA